MTKDKKKKFDLIKASEKSPSYGVYKCRLCDHIGDYSHQQVKRDGVSCQGCRLIRIREKARCQGFTLLSTNPRDKVKTYSCAGCGAVKNYGDHPVTHNNMICISCKGKERDDNREKEKKRRRDQKQEERKEFLTKKNGVPYDDKLVEAAIACGFQIIGEGKNRFYKRYRCNTCDGINEKTMSCMKAGKVRCDHCYLDRLKKEANACGFQLIGESFVSAHKRRYSCLTCNREYDLETGAVREKRTICRGCRFDRWQKEVTTHGFELTNPEQKGLRKEFRCLRCGAVSNRFLADVRKGNVVCKSCSSSHWDKPSNFYVNILTHQGFEDKSWVKIGVAYDLNARVKAYKLIEGTTVKTVETISCKDRFFSTTEYEKPLKKELASLQYNKELMKSFMGSGHTECYHIDSLKIISNFLNNPLDEKCVIEQGLKETPTNTFGKVLKKFNLLKYFCEFLSI